MAVQEVVRPVTRRWTVHEYHRMGEAGILGEDDRVELIDGEVVEMAPIGGWHAGRVTQLTRLLGRQLAEEFLLAVQNPVRLGERDEPQPDLSVIRDRDYGRSLPEPADVLLVVEVADTSLAYDRSVKLPNYARAGIPEAWLVDLNGAVVLQCTEPAADGYRRVLPRRAGDVLRSDALPGLSVAVAAVLG
jgi:Uma2 family endonuclease